MQSGENSVRFELRTGAVTIDAGLLEKLKEAMLAFVEGDNFPRRFLEIRDAMRAELKSAAVWIDGDQLEVGAWKVMHQDGRIVLVRYPEPTTGTMYIYRATIEAEGSKWRVVSLEMERKSGLD